MLCPFVQCGKVMQLRNLSKGTSTIAPNDVTGTPTGFASAQPIASQSKAGVSGLSSFT